MTRMGITRLWICLAATCLGSCSMLPSEFNLSPLYRHRLDQEGKVLEMDLVWPLIHYETTAAGGSDFRIRPLYRRVTEPDLAGVSPQPQAETGQSQDSAPLSRSEHQFLWPLGRVRSSADETHARLFPVFSYDGRKFVDGRWESDWYWLFPFFWGGSDQESPEADPEHYFGMFPIYLDAPAEFLTYDRLTFALWPLYTRTEKDQRVGHMAFWPLLGMGAGPKESDTRWHRFLPFYNYIAKAGRFARYSVLYPFVSWSQEYLDTDDPMSTFALWPLASYQSSNKINAWSFLWPLFGGQEVADKKQRLDVLWPLFRSLYDNTSGKDIRQWWLWPLVSRTTAKHQDSWSLLWPLIWWRQYQDPDGTQTQRWVLPFYKSVHRAGKDGGEDDYLQVWPLLHHETTQAGTGEWSIPSPWFYRGGNEVGVSEAYDWAYTLVKGHSRALDDHAVETAANLFTTRTRGQHTQTSVPFLFSYESDGKNSTLYIFNCIPIPLGGN